MLNFLKQFILHPKDTGAIWPTGNDLARLIVQLAELETAKSIVEFGPGTGVITQKIIEELPVNSTFFSIEKNKEFYYVFKKKFPNIEVFNDSASNIVNLLKDSGLPNCDRIISGLPWASFSDELQTEIIEAAYKALRSKGIFVTFSYLHSRVIPSGARFVKLLRHTFKNVERSQIVWQNIPPAFV